MNKLSFYEQVGIVIPGALFLTALIIFSPSVVPGLMISDISIGEFGVFLLIAYATGHAVAAVGNIVEKIWWWFQGGMPSNWVILKRPAILSEAQCTNLILRIKEVCNLDVSSLNGMNRADWEPIFGQIYRYSLSKSLLRIETFNGNYGLNRGLASALISAAAIIAIIDPMSWKICLVLMAISLVYLYRMNRFGVHFAREVFFAFLNS